MGVAVDAMRDRVYTAHQRMTFDFTGALFEERIRAFDGALNPVAEWVVPHEFASSAIQLAGVFTDAEGFVWTAGVETPPAPLTSRLIVARLQPSLEGEPLIHRLTLGAQGGTIRAAVDPRGGLILAGERDAAGNSDYFRRVSPDGFLPSFRRQGFAGGPLAVDLEGALYLGGRNPLNNAPSIIKLGLDNAPVWSPAHLELPGDRVIQALVVLAHDTFDVAGSRDVPFPGSDQSFISRYAPGTGGKLVAISPLEQLGFVDVLLPSPLVVEAQDAAGLPSPDVGIAFSIDATPDGAVGHQLIGSEDKTNALGRAKTDFKLGNIPLEYQVKAECSTCDESDQQLQFRICGKLPGDLYRQNEDRPGKAPYVDDFIGGSTNEDDRIRYSGCALTAYTMLLNIFRARHNLTYPESTPGTLNKALTPGGFVPVARLDFLSATRQFAGNQLAYDGFNVGPTMSIAEALQEVDRSLGRGDPALIKLNSPSGRDGHYITAIGRCGSRYIILDPFTGTDIELYDPDNPPRNLRVQGVRIFRKGA
ncbi:MAG: hypothetical protein AB1725_10570 [Armatimonadota bacterium]